MDPIVAAAVAEAHRTQWAFVLAAATRLTGDLDEAEECAQDAYAQALASWPQMGVPDRPGGWLTMVARRRAMDLLRRRDRPGSRQAAPAGRAGQHARRGESRHRRRR